MPVQVSWGNPQKTIIHAVFGEAWTLEEYHAMIDDIHKLVTSVDHTVHIISDFSANRVSPAKMLSAGRHVENRKTPNSGINIIVNAGSFLKAMAQVSMRLFLKDVKIAFADSLQDAYRIIEQYEQANTGK